MELIRPAGFREGVFTESEDNKRTTGTRTHPGGRDGEALTLHLSGFTLSVTHDPGKMNSGEATEEGPTDPDTEAFFKTGRMDGREEEKGNVWLPPVFSEI